MIIKHILRWVSQGTFFKAFLKSNGLQGKATDFLTPPKIRIIHVFDLILAYYLYSLYKS